jgi:hypothetical protein
MSQPKPVDPNGLEARLVATLPRYQPEQTVTGTISLWGHGNRALPWMRNLVDKWQAGFRKFHPGVKLSRPVEKTEVIVIGVAHVWLANAGAHASEQALMRSSC